MPATADKRGPVVVTGGAGFIGSSVRRRAAARGQRAIALVRACEAGLLGPDAEHRVVGWTDPDELASCLRDLSPALVVHCAGATARGAETIAGLYDANVGLTARLLEGVAAACPGAGVVLLSSAAVYGPHAPVPTPESAPLDPESHYAASKVMTELLGRTFARRSGLRCAVARPFNVVGPNEPSGSVISDIGAQVFRAPVGATVTVGLRETTSVRDFVDVEDVADALLTIAESGETGLAYNVCCGAGTSIAELVELAARTWGRVIEPLIQSPAAAGTVSIGDANRLRALEWSPRHSLAESLERLRGGAEMRVV